MTDVTIAVGETLVVTVDGAAGPAVAIVGEADGAVRLRPPAGPGTPGPFVHAAAPEPADQPGARFAPPVIFGEGGPDGQA